MEQTLTRPEKKVDLDRLLKLARAVSSGGEAKVMIQGGSVRVNGEVETRRRRTCRSGDLIELDGGPTLRLAAEA